MLFFGRLSSKLWSVFCYSCIHRVAACLEQQSGNSTLFVLPHCMRAKINLQAHAHIDIASTNPTCRRIACILVGSGAYHRAGHQLAHLLLSQPPIELLAMPQSCIRWLWSMHEFQRECALLLSEWAKWRSNQRTRSVADIEELLRIEAVDELSPEKLSDASYLSHLCCCEEGKSAKFESRGLTFFDSKSFLLAASSLFVSLLIVHLPSICADGHTLQAVLELIEETIAFAQMAASTSESISPEPDALRSFANPELLAALGRVLMSLPGPRERIARATALRLLTSLLILVPQSAEANVLGALHHAVALLQSALPSGHMLELPLAVESISVNQLGGFELP